jgi:hypothetical protein
VLNRSKYFGEKITFSLSGIKSLEEGLKKYQGDLTDISEKIIGEVAEIGRDFVKTERGYEGTTQLPIVKEANKVTGGIQVEHAGIAFKEFGTGIVGKNNPHPYATLNNWQYLIGHSVNSARHGENTWVYKKGENFYTTQGQKASRTFFKAREVMRENLIPVSKKYLGGNK